MLKVGITGGIGSGKSTVCRIFKLLGIPVYDADERARYLMHSDPELVAGIRALFGEQAYLPDGSLNRAAIAQKAFHDPGVLQQLNALVHPRVVIDTLEWAGQQQGVPYVLKEAALLIESRSHLQLDKLIVVTAPEEIRIQRVMQRDGATREAVEARMRNQVAEEEKIALADYLIHNDGQQSLIAQVMLIHRVLVALK